MACRFSHRRNGCTNQGVGHLEGGRPTVGNGKVWANCVHIWIVRPITVKYEEIYVLIFDSDWLIFNYYYLHSLDIYTVCYHTEQHSVSLYTVFWLIRSNDLAVSRKLDRQIEQVSWTLNTVVGRVFRGQLDPYPRPFDRPNDPTDLAHKSGT